MTFESTIIKLTSGIVAQNSCHEILVYDTDTEAYRDSRIYYPVRNKMKIDS